MLKVDKECCSEFQVTMSLQRENSLFDDDVNWSKACRYVLLCSGRFEKSPLFVVSAGSTCIIYFEILTCYIYKL